MHESLVNYGSGQPKVVLCLHEEISVAIAQGYGAVTGKPMAVAVHDMVGLQHASMAIYNAWCDKSPVLVLGGGSPLDPTKRKNSSEWLLAGIVPGNLVRDFVKWDDYVINTSSLPETLIRAYRLAMQKPQGPVFVCLDAAMQESRIDETVEVPFFEETLKTSVLQPDPDRLREAASLLVKAEMPVILANQAGQDSQVVPSLVELAELLAAPVVDLGRRFNFPGNNPLDLTGAAQNILSRADVLLALEVEDLWGCLHTVSFDREKTTRLLNPKCQIIDIGLRDLATRGLVQNYQRLQTARIPITADTAAAIPQLVVQCQQLLEGRSRTVLDERSQWIQKKHLDSRKQWQQEAETQCNERPIAVPWLLHQTWPAIRNKDWVLCSGHTLLAQWARRLWELDKPYQFMHGGGIGLGKDMGVAIGVALANRGQGRIVINLQADGDLLYTPQSIWTAAHYRIPLVTIIYNNRCYGNTEGQFRVVSLSRGRSDENIGEGIYIDGPPVDFATMARSFGAYAEGPIVAPEEVAPAIKRAVDEAEKNNIPAIVDVVCRRGGGRGSFI